MPVKRIVPLAAAAVFCAAMALFMLCTQEDPCAISPTTTMGCVGYCPATQIGCPGYQEPATCATNLTPSCPGYCAAYGVSAECCQYNTAFPGCDCFSNPFASATCPQCAVASPPQGCPNYQPPGVNPCDANPFASATCPQCAVASPPQGCPNYTGGGGTTYTLTLTAGAGGGVSKNPDKPAYAPNEQVLITAAADPNNVFTGWSGDAEGTASPLTVTMNRNLIIMAQFTIDNTEPPGGDGPFTLTINVNPADGGSATPEPAIGAGPAWGPYAAGASVRISYEQNAGYEFDGWTGDGSGPAGGVRTVRMTANRTVTANFEQSGQPPGGQKYNLNLDITTPAAKNSGKCSVTHPLGGLGQYAYDANTSITVTAAGGAPYKFEGWSEGTAQTYISTSLSYTFTIGKNTDLTARFIDTTTVAIYPYCRWEGNSSKCWQINPHSTDPDVTKSETECVAKKGEVVQSCADASTGVWCSYPASTSNPATCAWEPEGAAKCAKDGTVVSSCP